MSTPQEASFVGFMSRHLVVLACYRDQRTDVGTKFERGWSTFTGFILELHGQWFWVTAGHCLMEALDQNIESGSVRLLRTSFMDYFGNGASDYHTVPFEYEVGCGFYIENAELGIDFGLIPLDFNKCQLMAANGIIPVSRFNWEQQSSLEFDAYAMLGIPETEVYPSAHPESIGVRPSFAGIDRLPPTEVPYASSDQWFMGRLRGDGLRTVKGMSGGPIFGFRKVVIEGIEQWTYHVVAVQSRWIAGERIIFGCSLPAVAEHLHEAMAEAVAIASTGEGI
jgi:hypothetical protein